MGKDLAAVRQARFRSSTMKASESSRTLFGPLPAEHRDVHPSHKHLQPIDQTDGRRLLARRSVVGVIKLHESRKRRDAPRWAIACTPSRSIDRALQVARRSRIHCNNDVPADAGKQGPPSMPSRERHVLQ